MSRLAIPLLAFGLWLVLAASALAQTSTGTDFWLGFPDAYAGVTPPSFSVLITASGSTSGTVSVPGTAFTQAFTVAPGTGTTVALPAGVEDETADSVTTGHAIHVVADAPVAVDAVNAQEGLGDGFLGLPAAADGTAYRILDYPGNSQCGHAEFEVVATQDATTVTITPTAALTGPRPAGVAFSPVLDAGSTYLGQVAGTDSAGGTVITANQPVAVIAGTSCGRVDPATSGASNFLEQLPPLPDWGGDVDVLPFAGRGGDQLTVLGSSDGTQVSARTATGPVPGGPASVNAGQAVTFQITAPTHIHASAPILVGHFAYGADHDAGVGDPTMIIVTPTDHGAYTQTFAVPGGAFTTSHVNVVLAEADAGTLTLDGTAVPAASFAPAGDSATDVGATLDVTAGAHTLSAAGPVEAEVYGFAPSDAFGWPGALGDGSRAPVATPTPTATPTASPAPTAGPSPTPTPVKRVRFGDVVTLPSNHGCHASRAYAIRFKRPAGATLAKVTVRATGHAPVTRTGKRIGTRLRVRAGTRSHVRLRVTVTLAGGHVLTGSRRFVRCRPN